MSTTRLRARPLWLVVTLAIGAGCGGGKSGAAGPAGPAEPGDTDCEPGRCLSDISGVIDDHRPEARACFDDRRGVEPTLAGGRLIINFEIDPGGTVVDASQSAQDDQISDLEVVDCVVGVIRDLHFAPSAKGKLTRAFHRFEFSAPSK